MSVCWSFYLFIYYIILFIYYIIYYLLSFFSFFSILPELNNGPAKSSLEKRLSNKGKFPKRTTHKLTQFRHCKELNLNNEEDCYKHVRIWDILFLFSLSYASLRYDTFSILTLIVLLTYMHMFMCMYAFYIILGGKLYQRFFS